jgi:hypothetical protein
MSGCENEINPKEVALKFDRILAEQISRYPLLQLQDLYKLIHQGALGSEHAVEDEESARRWLREEVQNLQEGPQEPLIDPISPSGDIVRINLRPYLRSGKDLDSLLAAFIKTANEYRGSVEVLRRSWAYARRMASEGSLPFKIEEMDAFLVRMAKDGFPAVHHSAVYEEAYRPAYRVVAAIYIPELVGEGSNL